MPPTREDILKAREAVKKAQIHLGQLYHTCNHIIEKCGDSAGCVICDTDFGWWCPDSKDHKCEYDENEWCIHCEQPDERK